MSEAGIGVGCGVGKGVGIDGGSESCAIPGAAAAKLRSTIDPAATRRRYTDRFIEAFLIHPPGPSTIDVVRDHTSLAAKRRQIHSLGREPQE
jgi:predicted naringenin-chalcone synthase